jgi:hypothetical protein
VSVEEIDAGEGDEEIIILDDEEEKVEGNNVH